MKRTPKVFCLTFGVHFIVAALYYVQKELFISKEVRDL